MLLTSKPQFNLQKQKNFIRTSASHRLLTVGIIIYLKLSSSLNRQSSSKFCSISFTDLKKLLKSFPFSQSFEKITCTVGNQKQVKVNTNAESGSQWVKTTLSRSHTFVFDTENSTNFFNIIYLLQSHKKI